MKKRVLPIQIIYLFVVLLISACSQRTGSIKTPLAQAVLACQSGPSDWQGADLSDATLLGDDRTNETHFADYIMNLSTLDSIRLKASVDDFLDHTRKDTGGRVFAYYLSLAGRYLYDPNSPYRNEELYIPFMQYVLDHTPSQAAEHQRAAFQMGMILKNRPGTSARDIRYSLEKGSTGSLYGIHSGYTLLYFYNPGCSACKQATAFLKDSPLINTLIADRQLSLLAIYPDQDAKAWKEHLQEMPASWIRGWDKQGAINRERLYDLRATPSLYLLDHNKKVLLKDALPEQVERFLSGQKQPCAQ